MDPINLNAPLVKLTPTTSNDSDALQTGCKQVVVYNKGPSDVFMASSSAASTTAVVNERACVAAGSTQAFTVDQSHRSIAAICEAGSATVYVQMGPGV